MGRLRLVIRDEEGEGGRWGEVGRKAWGGDCDLSGKEGLRLCGDGRGGEGERLILDVCFLPLNKGGLVDGRGTASGGGCCLKDSLGEGGGLALLLSDPRGEARGLESGDWGRTVDGALRNPVPPLPLARDG